MTKRADRIRAVDLHFFLDPETGEPHIYGHGVTEEELEEVLSNPSEERPGRGSSRVVIGATEAGRVLRVIYASDPDPPALFVITAYDLRGKPLAAYRRRQRRKRRR
jgi:Domain of unknown function (DUF4258)